MVEPKPHRYARLAFPRREAPRRRLDPGLVLRDHKAALADAPGQLRMGGRVVAVDPAAEHGDRHALSLERAAMSLAIDASRQPADDDEPRPRQLSTEHSGDLRPVGRACARADDRNRRSREKLNLPGAAEVSTRGGSWISRRSSGN